MKQRVCSFCGKKQDEVEHMINAGDSHINICSECVEMCSGILASRRLIDKPEPGELYLGEDMSQR